jgi:transaldolase
VFAGRIADTGRDPLPILERSLEIMSENPLAELIWASPREVLNIFQADQIGCHIITVTSEILAKTQIVGKDLLQYSRETVEMFRKDAIACNFKI